MTTSVEQIAQLIAGIHGSQDLFRRGSAGISTTKSRRQRPVLPLWKMILWALFARRRSMTPALIRR